MAEKIEKESAQKTEALVLRDGRFGKCGEVVTLSAADIAVGTQDGSLDVHPGAVKAAKAPAKATEDE